MFESITLDQLTMLSAVAEEGSFSAAGRKLGRVQSAVSHAIASLEANLGVQLFDRAGRQPQLTEAGARVVAEARLVLSQVRAFSRTAAELHEGIEPGIDVVVDTMFPRRWMVEALARFSEMFPRVTVTVREALLNDAVQAIVRGEADVGICNLVDTDSDRLTVRPLTEIDLVPVCAAEHPLADTATPQPMSLLQTHTQVVLTQRVTQEPSEDKGVLAARTWRVASLETKLELLVAGVGWGSMPWPMVVEHIAAERLVALAPEPWPHGHRIVLHATQRADRPLGRATRGFFEAIEAARPGVGDALRP
jgi:DNA-binding transcriptional LysR family regulator